MSTLSFQSIPIRLAVGGAAIVYFAIRVFAKRVRRDKRHLRAEVREERDALRCMIEALPEQLESAKRAKMAVATQQWLDEMEADLAEAKLMGSQLPAADTEDADHSGMDLDIKLAEILALSIRVNRIADKYGLPLTEEHPAGLGADAESLFEQAASLPAQARARHAGVSV
jgi:hypothetical protein